MNVYSLIYFVCTNLLNPDWAMFYIKLSFRKGRQRSCKPRNFMVGTSKLENNIFLTMQEWAPRFTFWLSKTFIVVGKIKEAIVRKTFPDRACRQVVALLWLVAILKYPTYIFVQSVNLIYVPDNSPDSIIWHNCHFYFWRCHF